jgi:hypothetical protein
MNRRDLFKAAAAGVACAALPVQAASRAWVIAFRLLMGRKVDAPEQMIPVVTDDGDITGVYFARDFFPRATGRGVAYFNDETKRYEVIAVEQPSLKYFYVTIAEPCEGTPWLPTIELSDSKAGS